MKIIEKPLLKIVSILLCLGFLSQDLAAVSAFDGAASPRPPVFSPIHFSASFAKVQDEWQGHAPFRIIHVQDAHTNVGAQKNIARIIEELVTRYGVDTVFIEGGTRDDSLNFLRPFASKEKRERIAKKHLLAGGLSGAEYLNVVSDLDFGLMGY